MKFTCSFVFVFIFLLNYEKCESQTNSVTSFLRNVTSRIKLDSLDSKSLNKEVTSSNANKNTNPNNNNNNNSNNDDNSEDSDVEDYNDDDDEEDDDENDEENGDDDDIDLAETQRDEKKFSNSSFNEYNLNSTNLTSNETSEQSKYRSKKFRLDKLVTTSADLVKLRKGLLEFYDRYSRPLANSSNPILVKMGISILQVNNLDEMYQVMTSTLQVSLRWRDEFIAWNTSIYPNDIAFKSHEIWVPDILATNNVNNFKYDSKESYLRGYSNNIFDFNERNKYHIQCQPEGECRWVFPMKLMSNCQLNQEYFPFDIQQCHLDFRSSAYDKSQMLVQRFHSGVHLKLINEAEFDLLKADAEDLASSNDEFNSNPKLNQSIIRVNLLMKRKTIFYLNKIILPYFTFYIVTIFTYLLPVDSGEKKSYCTSILISGMIYLKDTSYYIPKTKDLPMISIYFNLNLIFIFLCIILSTFIYTIYYMDKTKRPLPHFLKKYIVHNRLISLLCFGDHQSPTELKPKKTKKKSPTKNRLSSKRLISI